MTELWKYDAVGLIEAFSTSSLSPRDVLTQTLSRIDSLQPHINAYSCQNNRLMADAIASEQRWESNAPIGALDGVPIVIKDNMAVKGMPASWGNAELATRTVDRDELPVERLRKAGALILGKANTPEFAVEGYTANTLFGTTGNPYNPLLTPGGSSGAVAAAVASGQAALGIGTDGGGSIRRPAAYCGLIGLKPGLGRYPRANGLPQVLLDFEVVGPMTRTVRDARLMDSILNGASRLDPMSRRVTKARTGQPLRILYVPTVNNEPCDSVLQHRARDYVDQLSNNNYHVAQGELPLDLASMMSHWHTVAEVGMAQLFNTDKALDRSASTRYRQMAERGRHVTVDQLWQILETVKFLRIQASLLFADWDIVVSPAAAAMPWDAAEPFPHIIDGAEVGPRGHAIYSGWVNATGHPAISLPVQPAPNGLPVGVQLVGDLGSEDLLLQLAEQHEARIGGFQWPALPRQP